jgi:hypothetical protein
MNARSPTVARVSASGPPASRHDWAVTAVHESGHICSYLFYGLRFGHARIFLEGNKVLGRVFAPLPADPIERAVCYLAGPCAEEKLTGVSWTSQPNSASDREMAQAALDRLGDGTSLAAVAAQARMIVVRNWGTIQTISDHLMFHRVMSFEHVRSLVQRR